MVLTVYGRNGIISVMEDTIRVQIRWPKVMVDRLQTLAKRRQTTFSELVRQAAVEQYALAHDETATESDANIDKKESLIS